MEAGAVIADADGGGDGGAVRGGAGVAQLQALAVADAAGGASESAAVDGVFAAADADGYGDVDAADGNAVGEHGFAKFDVVAAGEAEGVGRGVVGDASGYGLEITLDTADGERGDHAGFVLRAAGVADLDGAIGAQGGGSGAVIAAAVEAVFAIADAQAGVGVKAADGDSLRFNNGVSGYSVLRGEGEGVGNAIGGGAGGGLEGGAVVAYGYGCYGGD